MPDQALGGASLDVKQNYWGTTDIPTITALMQVPAITNFTPISQNDNQYPSVGGASPIDSSDSSNGNGNGKGQKNKR